MSPNADVIITPIGTGLGQMAVVDTPETTDDFGAKAFLVELENAAGTSTESGMFDWIAIPTS